MAKNMAYQAEDITCYANTEADSDFVKNYGCLYSWKDAKKVCPDGWKLPGKDELNALLTAVGGANENGAQKLRDASWEEGLGSDGFAALPSGIYYEDNVTSEYRNFGAQSTFWGLTLTSGNADILFLSGSSAELNTSNIGDVVHMVYGRSVRCVKADCGDHSAWDSVEEACVCTGNFSGENCDECKEGWDIATNCTTCKTGWTGDNCVEVKCVHGTTDAQTGHCEEGTCDPRYTGEDCNQCKADGTQGTLIDTEDNNKSYKTTIVDCQEWMAENMARVPASGTYYHVNGGERYDATYGLLYDWDTARHICPEGWKLPSKQDFDALLTYVATDDPDDVNRSKNLRASSWEEGADTVGFAVLPAGAYDANYGYTFGSEAVFWSSTELQDSASDAWDLYFDTTEGNTNCNEKYKAFSVRCIRKAVAAE